MTNKGFILYPENGNVPHFEFFKGGVFVNVLEIGKSACFGKVGSNQTLTTSPITELSVYGNGYFDIRTQSGSHYQLTI